MGTLSTTNPRSLKEYRLIAEKIVGRNFKPHFQDPDIIDEAIKALFRADSNFDGRGSLMGYRSQQVKRAVKWRLSLNSRIQKKLQTYNENIDLAYEVPEPCEIFEAAQQNLSLQEYRVIEMKFKLGMNCREISEKLKTKLTDSNIAAIIRKLRSTLKKESFV